MFNMEINPFKNKIWLATPTMHGDEIKYIQKAYDTNWMSTVGENIDEVEKQIADFLGVKHTVGLTTGTAALHLCTKSAGVKSGVTVACSDMTFSATVNPVTYEGGKTIFVDTERDTWNMNPVALEKAFSIHPEIEVVIVAHLYGTPGKLEEIKRICDEHNAILIEDAAESFGATYKGKQTGTFGKYNAISFNGNKIITGSAGGVFISDSDEADKCVRKWSTQSRDSSPWYQHSEIGYNYRMSNVIAGVVRGQLPYLQEHIAQKKAIYERYKKGFEGLPISMNPYDDENSEPNFWLSCMIIDKEAMCPQNRDENTASYEPQHGKSCPTEILESLAKFNIEGRPIWKPMHMQPLYKQCEFVSAEDGADVSADIFERGLCLPSDNKMTIETQDKIIEIIRNCFE